MTQEVAPKVVSRTEPRRRLSIPRVLFALLLLGTAGYGASMFWQKKQEAAAEAITYKPWFASYVDVTSTPTYAFEQLGATSNSDVVLSFIVSSPQDACTPTWGTFFTLDQAGLNMDLDRRIARLRQQGGRVAVSFGGALNDELAVKCTDPDKLLAAYKSVVDRYNIDTIDLDVEGASLGDKDSVMRRAGAIARLQKEQRDNGKNLAVWLTLPVIPQGLTPEGTNAVAQMLSEKVDLAGVNVMTMDYGESKDKNQSMGDAGKSALTETHRQLGILYKQAGITLGNQTLWGKIGATPMIGQNDVVAEVFTIDDAKTLNDFAVAQGVGRMSMWSANRDLPCGENYVDTKVVSDSCSGVKTPKGEFTKVLSNSFDGNLSESSQKLTTAETVPTPVPDDPEKSPYQIWQATGAYPKGVKVVWHGNVYQAKWWTKNDLPDNPVLQSWETPWQLVGPVLPGDKPIQQPTLPKGTYPNWSGTVIYEGGDRVLFEGIPFQAKWWNQGESPAASAANPDNSPWVPLTQAQIEDILNRLQNKK